MSRVAIVSTCVLNQCAMDVTGNVERIVESVRQAKARGARYRCGPEMDVTGYGCGDHFLEADTLRHAWEGVAQLLQHEVCSSGILVDVGLPVQHKNVVYNCKLVFLNRKVLLIRPKMMLADDSHMGYQETRWFTPWQKVRQVEEHQLPPCITKVTGQRSVPFGDALLMTHDTTIGYEICEELWNPDSPIMGMSLDGAEIICNGSGALQELSHPDTAYRLILMATHRSGGCYLFANLKGCDGSLGYYAGDACIAVNGRMVAAAPLHTLHQVEVLTAVVNLDAVLTHRNLIRSRCRGAAASPAYPRVQVDFTLCQEEEERKNEEKDDDDDDGEEKQNKKDKSMTERGQLTLPLSLPTEPPFPTLAEQVLEGAACWLWDYLRRSQRRGLLLELSGKVSDAATAAIVFTMCQKVMEALPLHPQVQADLLSVTGGTLPKEVHELCGRLLVTFPSHTHTNPLVAALAQQIGSDHVTPSMEGDAVLEQIRSAQKMTEGEYEENSTHALRHLHAFRARLLALRVARGELGRGGARQLLILATTPAGDMPAAFRGTTRPSSRPIGGGGGGHFGDVSVVGHIPRGILPEVLMLAKERFNLPVLTDVLEEERKDKTKEKKETEEKEEEEEAWAEMWTLHREEHLGPHSMFLSLMHRWRGTHTPAQVAKRVQMFFTAHGTSPPGAPDYCVKGVGPLQPARPLLNQGTLSWQFKAINDEVKKLQDQGHEDE